MRSLQKESFTKSRGITRKERRGKERKKGVATM